MKLSLIKILILITTCSANYDEEQNFSEYVPKIFMGISGK
tara:strand:- start:1246 stop:1365 length:120 start_codon:yes stop_codon:yes gene_type:complete